MTFPAGTALGTFTNAQVFDITSNRSVGNCGAAVGQLIQCQLFTNEVIAAGDQVRITFNAITNPATPGPYTLDVSTTSDTTPVSSPAYNVVAANLLTGVTVVNGSPSAGAGARTQYVVGFTTSATGGLSAGANSRISVTFPAGTALGTFTNAQVFDIAGDRSVGNCGAAVGQLIQCQLFTNEVIAAGDQVRITFNAITNPATPGPYTLDVSTTSDTTPVSSPAYNVVAANLLTAVTLTLDSPSPSATTRWIANFTTSATGGLSAGANSRISVTFPAGTGLGTFTNAQVFDITSNRSVGNCGAAVGQLIQCQLFTNEVIAAGDQVRITFNAITNPAMPGPYTLDVSTTSDTTPSPPVPASPTPHRPTR